MAITSIINELEIQKKVDGILQGRENFIYEQVNMFWLSLLILTYQPYV